MRINRWFWLWLLLIVMTLVLLATANLSIAVILWIIAPIMIVLYQQFRPRSSPVQRRYFILRLLSALLKINGIVYLVSAVSNQFFMWALQNRIFPPDTPNFSVPFTFIPPFVSFLITPLPIVAGIVAAILLYGAGELIDLLIAHEENSRTLAQSEK